MSSTTSQKNSVFALLALAISAFGIGTTEFVPVGLLSAMADDLSISITVAGLLISGYAIGVAIGAPVLTALTSKMNRKTLLLSLMFVFIVGNSLAALSTSFPLLLLARFITAFSHGIFFSIGATIAADLVAPSKRASAIAFMFTGLTVATVTGVPLGTFIGQLFDWRATFAAVALLGVIGAIAIFFLLPSTLKQPPKARLTDQVAVLRNKPIMLAFAITALGYGGTFVTFTYLTPLLQEVTKFSASTISILLLLYGIAVAIGNVIGGKLSNHKPLRALQWMFVGQAVILLFVSVAAPTKSLMLVAIFLLGLFAFMNVPGLQLVVVTLAEKYTPAAVNVASAFNIAAFNVGIAIGSIIGGIIIDSIGVIHTPWIGAIMVCGAVLLTALLRKKEME